MKYGNEEWKDPRKTPMYAQVGSTSDDDDEFDDDEDEDEEEEEVNEIVISFACEDCDYRWEVVVEENEEEEEDYEESHYCPMCGSSNVTQI